MLPLFFFSNLKIKPIVSCKLVWAILSTAKQSKPIDIKPNVSYAVELAAHPSKHQLNHYHPKHHRFDFVPTNYNHEAQLSQCEQGITSNNITKIPFSLSNRGYAVSLPPTLAVIFDIRLGLNPKTSLISEADTPKISFEN